MRPKGHVICTCDVILFANSAKMAETVVKPVRRGGRYCVAGAPNQKSCQNTSYTLESPCINFLLANNVIDFGALVCKDFIRTQIRQKTYSHKMFSLNHFYCWKHVSSLITPDCNILRLINRGSFKSPKGFLILINNIYY